MITRSIVRDQLLAYLNGAATLAALVDWAENAIMNDEFVPDEDIDQLMDMMTYLAAADTEFFPLTREVITEFLAQLGTQVRIITEVK